MKIATIYSNAAPQLISAIEGELKRSLREEKPLYIMTRSDPSLLAETNEAGYVKASTARRLIRMYLEAADSGADIVYSCSIAMGDVAFNAVNLFDKLGIKIVRIDEFMVEAAIEQGKTIGLIATQRASLDPCHRMLMRCAAAKGADIKCVDIPVLNAYGKMRDETAKLIAEAVERLNEDIDVFVLAQESLVLCEKELQQILDRPVLSPAKYGAMAVRQAVLSMRNYDALPDGEDEDIQDISDENVEIVNDQEKKED